MDKYDAGLSLATVEEERGDEGLAPGRFRHAHAHGVPLQGG